MSLDEARLEARRLHEVHKTGGDIKEAHRNPAPRKDEDALPTLREVALLWWEKKKTGYKPTTQQSYKSILYNVILKSKLADAPIKNIKFTDIDEIYTEEYKNHPVQANRMVPVLSKIFKFAEQFEYRGPNSNVCKLLERPSEDPRDRVLTPHEFIKLNDAIQNLRENGSRDRDKEISNTMADMFLFCAYSGLRPAEAKKIQWATIKNDPPHIKFEDHKTQNRTRTKPKFIPLNSFLIEIIKKREAFKTNDYVFNGRKTNGHITGYQRPWLLVCDLAKLKNFHLHDFRRIFRTRCLEFKYTDSIADSLLGHSLGKVRGTYTQFDPDGIIAEASQKISDWIDAQFHAESKSLKKKK